MAIPTKIAVKHQCGHTETRDLSKTPPGKRKSKAHWYSQNGTCSKCFKASQDGDKKKDQAQRALDAATFAEEHELPELTGSEKQIFWAGLIRAETLEAVLEEHQDAPSVIEAAKATTHAGWWMDNLGWSEQKENDYDADDFAELILTGPAAQAERDATHVESENPYE